MSSMMVIDIHDMAPELVIDAQVRALHASGESERLLLINYPFEEYWLDSRPVQILTAICLLERGSESVNIRYTVAEFSEQLLEILDRSSPAQAFESYCDVAKHPIFSPRQGVELHSIAIPKPWGQELWYTGIESRGVAKAGQGEALIPLPWVLSVFPKALTKGLHRSLVLLKVLDPLPDEVFGDLYFELHEEKREVYVVTAVDGAAWPDRTGAIRFGFDANKRAQYASDNAFREGFGASIRAYQKIRNTIDSCIDDLRIEAKLGLNVPVPAEQQSAWLQQLPQQLRDDELSARREMESFTELLPLNVGDVIKVPTLTPHSLQHGVRTVEFQTPVYERLILSFAQKVLTQGHWDTDRALELMSMEGQAETSFDRLDDENGVTIERIVDFKDFEVRRVNLPMGESLSINSPSEYALVMSVSGILEIAGMNLCPEQAGILPSSWSGGRLSVANEDRVFLLAYPK